MMNEMQIFQNEEFGQIRSLMIDDEPWFVGKDVAVALGYAKPQNAIKAHVDDEDKSTTPIQGTAYETRAIIINESGLYSLILSSKLEAAKRFKRWVTSEVLSTLRKTGRYTLQGQASEPLLPERAITPDDYIKAADIISRCTNTRLPIAVDLLSKAGIKIPLVTSSDGLYTDEIETGRLQLILQRYTVSEAAEKTGLARPVISRYRNGKSTPKADRYRMIVELLG